jgi:hypothetical protein
MSTNDPEFYQAPKFTPESQQPPRQRGCFFYGCIIASILLVLALILIGVGGYLLYRMVNGWVDEYTATAPRDLPKVEMPDPERKALKDRVEAFRKAVDEGKSVEPLVLTSNDLNALIAEEPDLQGKVYVKVEGDELKGQISIPLEKLGLPMFKGRYLNGEADLKASFNNGILIVTLDSLEVNGKHLPDEFMTNLRQQNLAKDAYKDPKNAEMLRKVESMAIKDGKIIIRVRAKGAQANGQPAEKELPGEVLAPASTKKAAAPSAETPPATTRSQPAESPQPKR